jgi:hypothetical protein
VTPGQDAQRLRRARLVDQVAAGAHRDVVAAERRRELVGRRRRSRRSGAALRSRRRAGVLVQAAARRLARAASVFGP